MYAEDILDKIEKFTMDDQHENWIHERKKVSALFEITPKCNFKCVHCYVGSDRTSSPMLSYEEIIKIIDILYDNGILFLTFSGGDPFTRKDFKDIYLYAKKKGFLVEVLTNGTMITSEWIDIFREYPPLLIDISIYGTSNEEYEKLTGVKNGYDLFIRGISLLQAAKIRFALKGILMNENYKQLKRMEEISSAYSSENFRYSYELVVDRQCTNAPRTYEVDPLEGVITEIKYGVNASMLKKRGKELLEGIDEDNYRDGMLYRCTIGDLAVHINYLGEMGPCVECGERGNVLKEDFNNICARFEKFKEKKAPSGYKCSGCRYKAFCTSCPQARRREYGNEIIVKTRDCIVAELKYLYFVNNLSIEELKDYYKKNYRR